MADAGVGPDDRVVEVGAGLGSLTLALAATGAEVLALELDRALLPALREVVEGYARVRLELADARRMDWDVALPPGGWKMVSNLPYNVAVPVILDMLERAPRIRDFVVMVQREVGERLAGRPGEDAYGAVSVRVAYHAEARLLRRVPAEVFWPRPKVESVLLRLTPRPAPVGVAKGALFRVVEASFAERRKTMLNALRRLGLDAPTAARVMEEAGLEPRVRAERLGLEDFARIAEALQREGAIN